MGLLLLFLILGLSIIGWLSFYISTRAFAYFQQTSPQYAVLFRILVFVVSFVVFTGIAFFIILANAPLSR